jgi:hypothetical protein
VCSFLVLNRTVSLSPKAVLINGGKVPAVAFATGNYRDVPTLSIKGQWKGVAFGKNHEILPTGTPTAPILPTGTATVPIRTMPAIAPEGSFGDASVALAAAMAPPSFAGGAWSGAFSIPSTVLTQLQERNRTYPIVWDTSTDGNDDANVPWLAPGRLLVFVKYAPLLNDTFNATGSIDGKALLMRKAYNTIVRSAARFIGYWADVTELIIPNTMQTLKLNLPAHTDGWVMKPGALLAGDDLGTVNTTVAGAEKLCKGTKGCVGFTFKNAGVACSAAAAPGSTTTAKMYLKSEMAGNGDAAWCNVLQPAVLVGVFFENVETIFSSDFHPQNN